MECGPGPRLEACISQTGCPQLSDGPSRAALPPLGCGEEGTQWSQCRDIKVSSLAPSAIRPEGKNNRLFVFSISMVSAQWSLDVAADSQEELQDWVKKIREVAQTADARVRTCWSPQGCWVGPLGALWKPYGSLSGGQGLQLQLLPLGRGLEETDKQAVTWHV